MKNCRVHVGDLAKNQVGESAMSCQASSRIGARVAAHKLLRLAVRICSASADGCTEPVGTLPTLCTQIYEASPTCELQFFRKASPCRKKNSPAGLPGSGFIDLGEIERILRCRRRADIPRQ